LGLLGNGDEQDHRYSSLSGQGPQRRAAHGGEAPGHTFADARKKPKATAGQYVSLINHASIAALARTIGAPVDPLRFRANVYCEGLPAWAEHEWLGREITIGTARLRVVSAITRCAATQVNASSAERDLDIVGTLQRTFGHNLMGVYGEVLHSGEMAVGDPITGANT
jgi:MOSC domain-containing protein